MANNNTNSSGNIYFPIPTNSSGSSTTSPVFTIPNNGNWYVGGGTITISPQQVTIFPEVDEVIIEQEKVEQHPKAKKITLPDGSEAMECVTCEKQYQWAEPNQDNGTLICYECRKLNE